MAIHQNFSNPTLVLSNLKDLVFLPSKVVQYPVLLATPMSTVAISVPSFTMFTLFALSPFIVVSSLFVIGINSSKKGGYLYSSFRSIINYNIASFSSQQQLGPGGDALQQGHVVLTGGVGALGPLASQFAVAGQDDQP